MRWEIGLQSEAGTGQVCPVPQSLEPAQGWRPLCIGNIQGAPGTRGSWGKWCPCVCRVGCPAVAGRCDSDLLGCLSVDPAPHPQLGTSLVYVGSPSSPLVPMGLQNSGLKWRGHSRASEREGGGSVPLTRGRGRTQAQSSGSLLCHKTCSRQWECP